MSNQTTPYREPWMFEIDQRKNFGREMIHAVLRDPQGLRLTIYVSRKQFEEMFEQVNPEEEGGEDEEDDYDYNDEEDEEIEDGEMDEDEEREEEEDGMHLKSIENLEKCKIEEFTMCSICLEEITPSSERREEEEEEAGQIPCNHVYHHKCILKWLSNHNTCPACRYNVTS